MIQTTHPPNTTHRPRPSAPSPYHIVSVQSIHPLAKHQTVPVYALGAIVPLEVVAPPPGRSLPLLLVLLTRIQVILIQGGVFVCKMRPALAINATK